MFVRSRDNYRSRQFQRQVVDPFSIGAYEVKSTMHVMSPYSLRHMAIMQNDSTTFTSALLISTLTPITLLNILFINPMRTLLKQKEAPSWMWPTVDLSTVTIKVKPFGLVSYEIIHSYAKVYVTVGIKEAIIRKLPLAYQEVKPNFIPL